MQIIRSPFNVAISDKVRHTFAFLFPTPRPNQLEVIQLVLNNLENYDNFVLTMPTGYGKSVIAVTLMRMFGTSFCVTHRRKLQTQYVNDFRIPTLMGRGNYECRGVCGYCPLDPMCTDRPCMCNEAPCILFPEPKDRYLDNIKQSRIDAYDASDVAGTITGDESLKMFTCKRVSSCSYHIAKMKALEAPHLVLGSKYSMIDAMYTHHFGHRDFVCFDEAHTLEEDLLSLIELTLKKSILDDLGISPDKSNWSETFDQIVGMKIGYIAKILGNTKNPLQAATDVRKMREYLGMMNHVEDIRKIYDAATWVCTEEKRKRGTVFTFKPVWVSTYAQKILPMIGDKRLFMSATLDAHLLADTLGLDDARTIWFNVEDSLFPARNRPIYATMTGNLTHKTMQQELPKVMDEIRRICTNHPHDRILILPYTHHLANEIDKHVKLPRQNDIEPYRMGLVKWVEETYDNSPAMTGYMVERLSLMKHDRRILGASNYRFLEIDIKCYETVPESVIITTYLTSGYDGVGDRVRAIIIPKWPWPSLEDEVIKKRLKENPRWYLLTSVQTFIQMYGRGCRSPDDWCKTYITDAQISNAFKRQPDAFPRWVRDALLWRRKNI